MTSDRLFSLAAKPLVLDLEAHRVAMVTEDAGPVIHIRVYSRLFVIDLALHTNKHEGGSPFSRLFDPRF